MKPQMLDDATMFVALIAPSEPGRKWMLSKTSVKPEDLASAKVGTTPRPILSPTEYGLNEILWCTSVALGIPLSWIRSPRRSRILVDARFIYYWLARDYTESSYSLIGRICGNRDHTTVMHGIERVVRRRMEYQELFNIVEAKLFERKLDGPVNSV